RHIRSVELRQAGKGRHDREPLDAGRPQGLIQSDFVLQNMLQVVLLLQRNTVPLRRQPLGYRSVLLIRIDERHRYPLSGQVRSPSHCGGSHSVTDPSCSSASMSVTGIPLAARYAAIVVAVVVLPAPPFWFTTATTSPGRIR